MLTTSLSKGKGRGKKNICSLKYEASNIKIDKKMKSLEEEVGRLRDEISNLGKEIEAIEDLEEKSDRFQSQTVNGLTKQNGEL